jgi:uncharacterized protein YneF (UPF0154 family)
MALRQPAVNPMRSGCFSEIRGETIVSIAVCLALLSGIVLGLRFNVRLLLMACLATIATGLAAPIVSTASVTTTLLWAVLCVVALQVGYFVAIVVNAMQLTEEPIPSSAPERRAPSLSDTVAGVRPRRR